MSNDIEDILSEVSDRAEKFGAYMKQAHVAASPTEVDEDTPQMTELPEGDDLKEMLKNDEVKVIAFTSFTLNELAFSDRVQNPLQVQEEDEFKVIIPTEAELLRERFQRNLDAGRDAWDDGED